MIRINTMVNGDVKGGGVCACMAASGIHGSPKTSNKKERDDHREVLPCELEKRQEQEYQGSTCGVDPNLEQ
jgi:hypothetical protein